MKFKKKFSKLSKFLFVLPSVIRTTSRHFFDLLTFDFLTFLFSGIVFEPIAGLLSMIVCHRSTGCVSAEVDVPFQNVKHGNPVKV